MTTTQNRLVDSLGWLIALAALVVSFLFCLEAIGQPPPLPVVIVPDDQGPEMQRVEFAWDASPDAGVAGYRLSWHTNHTTTDQTQAGLWVPIGTNITVECVAIADNGLISDPATLGTFLVWSNWVEVGTELLSGPDWRGPFTPLGTNALSFKPTKAQEFYTAQATINQRRAIIEASEGHN